MPPSFSGIIFGHKQTRAAIIAHTLANRNRGTFGSQTATQSTGARNENLEKSH
jgi:hypothetical protein